jgi:hypothetical protein
MGYAAPGHCGCDAGAAQAQEAPQAGGDRRLSVVPAIRMNAGCDYTDYLEPDQKRGWCDNCQTNSMKSCLILAGV